MDWDLTSSSDEDNEPDGILGTGEYFCGYCEQKYDKKFRVEMG